MDCAGFPFTRQVSHSPGSESSQVLFYVLFEFFAVDRKCRFWDYTDHADSSYPCHPRNPWLNRLRLGCSHPIAEFGDSADRGPGPSTPEAVPAPAPTSYNPESWSFDHGLYGLHGSRRFFFISVSSVQSVVKSVAASVALWMAGAHGDQPRDEQQAKGRSRGYWHQLQHDRRRCSPGQQHQPIHQP
jgi:hypothetical protein